MSAELFSKCLVNSHALANCNCTLFFPCQTLSSRPFFKVVSFHHYPNNKRTGRRKKKPFHRLTFLSDDDSSVSTSPDLDVISTHEHDDGSVLFRFGDPSEVVKVDQGEEDNVVVEEKSEEGVIIGEVLNGNHEGDVIVKNIEREAPVTGLGETDHSPDSADESTGVSERGHNLGENLSDLQEIEPVSDISMDSKEDGSSPSSVAVQDSFKDNGSVSVEELEEKGDEDSPLKTASAELHSAVEESDAQKDSQEVVGEGVTLSADAESLNVEPVLHNVVIEDKTDSKGAGSTPISPMLEAEPVLNEEPGHDPTVDSVGGAGTESAIKSAEAGKPDEITRDIVEVDLNEGVPTPVPLEFNSTLDEKSGSQGMDEELEADRMEIAGPQEAEPVSSYVVADDQDQQIRPGIQNDISEDVIEIDDGEVISMIPSLEAEEALDEEMPRDAVEELIEADKTENANAVEELIEADKTENSIVQEAEPISSYVDADDQDEHIRPGIQNDISKDATETDDGEVMSMIPSLESEEDLDEEMLGDVVEELIEADKIENANAVEELIEADKTEIAIVQEAERVSSNLDADDQDQEIRPGIQNDISEDVIEIDDGEVMSMIPSLEAGEALDEEMLGAAVEELIEADKTENAIVIENDSQSLGLGASLGSLQGNDLVESSEIKSTEIAVNSSTGSMDIPTSELVLSSGAALSPHPAKALAGGEDAYFLNGQSWLGVADGVSLWSLQGTNPGVYAQDLMKNCVKLVSDPIREPITNPEQLLRLSVVECRSPGSSTVFIAHFDGQALCVANVGDSGFIILRNGEVYQRSSPMIHEFQFPVQIESGTDPSEILETYRIDLREGDVIVIATDGLFDNLYEQEISSIVSKSLAADKKPQDIAKLLASRAQEVGRSPSARSPFADATKAAGYVGYTGGKLDDVTVILCLVQKQMNTPY